MKRVGQGFGTGLAVAALALSGLGCATARYRDNADAETYALIEEKAALVDGLHGAFSIETPEPFALDEFAVLDEESEFLGGEEAAQRGARIIPLDRALGIAVEYNREYLGRKEQLFLAALSLTLDRHQFAPIFSTSVPGAGLDREAYAGRREKFAEFLRDAPELAADLETLSGDAEVLLAQYHALIEAAPRLTGVGGPGDAHTLGDATRVRAKGTADATVKSEGSSDAESVSVGTKIELETLLRGGGRLSLELTNNLLRFLTGSSPDTAGTSLIGAFTQPLLRGAGTQMAFEQLTQAERNLLYEMREFSRFRKSFTVQVATQYYGVLRNLDSVRNNHQSLVRFDLNLERERAFAEEGLSTLASVGRLEQARLSQESSWINSVRQYQQNLDDFKILLGFSAEAHVVLDENELDRIRDRGIVHPALESAEAVELAKATRLDLLTAHDLIFDAERQVYVAADNLRPGLGLTVSGTLPSQDHNRALSPDFNAADWSAGLSLELPLDRKAERNAFRSSLISYEQSLRSYTLAVDNVTLEIRNAWRTLDQARRNYEINLTGVELNERRVEEQELRAELGLGNVLDQVDAQNDLTNSRNQLTAQLITHTIARLGFWRDIGILFIREDGQWEDYSDVESAD